MDTTTNKLLVLLILVALGSPCLGYRSGRFGRYRGSYHGYYSYRGTSSSSTGVIVGAVIGGIILIVGVCVLMFIIKKFCGRSQHRTNDTQMTTLSGNVNHMMTPPPYSAYDSKYKTGVEYNTKDNYGFPSGCPYPNTRPDVLPPPYHADLNYSSYPTDAPLPPYSETNSNSPPYPINDSMPAQGYPAQPLANLYGSNSTNENQSKQ